MARNPLYPPNPTALWCSLFRSGEWDTLAELMSHCPAQSPQADHIRSATFRMTLAGREAGVSENQRLLDFSAWMAHSSARALLSPGEEYLCDVKRGIETNALPGILEEARRLGLSGWAENPWDANAWSKLMAERDAKSDADIHHIAETFRAAGMPINLWALGRFWDERSSSFQRGVRYALAGQDGADALAQAMVYCILGIDQATRAPNGSMQVVSWLPVSDPSGYAKTLLEAGASPAEGVRILSAHYGSLEKDIPRKLGGARLQASQLIIEAHARRQEAAAIDQASSSARQSPPRPML